MEWNAVLALVSGIPSAHLATADDHGMPHVSKVAVGNDGEAFWLATRIGSAKARNLRVNPRAALLWEGNSAETYVWGVAEMFEDPAAKEQIWASGSLGYDPAPAFGSPDNPDLVIVRITATSATAMVHTDGSLERRVWKP